MECFGILLSFRESVSMSRAASQNSKGPKENEVPKFCDHKDNKVKHFVMKFTYFKCQFKPNKRYRKLINLVFLFKLPYYTFCLGKSLGKTFL